MSSTTNNNFFISNNFIKLSKNDTFENVTISFISRYIDTDSIYCSYEDVIKSTDWFDHQVWRLTKVNKQNDQKDFVYVSKGGYPTLDDAKEYFKVDDIGVMYFPTKEEAERELAKRGEQNAN
mgnify:CR=1 FL=1